MADGGFFSLLPLGFLSLAWLMMNERFWVSARENPGNGHVWHSFSDELVGLFKLGGRPGFFGVGQGVDP